MNETKRGKKQTKNTSQEHRQLPVKNIEKVYVQQSDIYRATSTFSYLFFSSFSKCRQTLCIMF